MKALQLETIGQLRLVELDLPAIGADEILVRTGAAVICTSDLNDIRENPFGIQMPVTIGHEGAGVVAALGKDVRGFHIGDHVATHPVHPCGKCANCTRGMGHLCTEMAHFGINRPGTFAEYYPVRVDRARPVDRGMPFHQAALAEPVSVCLEALDQAHLPVAGRLLVLGDGPFGVMIARLAGRYRPEKLVVAGWSDFRLGFAGGAVQVNTRQLADPYARLQAETGGLGYDAVILAVASPQAVQLGQRLLRSKGRLVIFAGMTGATAVDLFDLHVRELEIVGACNDQDLFDQAVSVLGDLALALGELVTHHFPLAAYPAALDLAANGRDRAMKVAFDFGEG